MAFEGSRKAAKDRADKAKTGCKTVFYKLAKGFFLSVAKQTFAVFYPDVSH